MPTVEPKPDSAESVVNPYAVAEKKQQAADVRLSWLQKKIVFGVSSCVSLVVLSLLLTVLWLVVSVLDSTQPYSRDVTQLIITFLLVGGAILSLGVSLLAGARSIRKMRKIMRTLSGPTTARVELEQQVAAMIRDRSQR